MPATAQSDPRAATPDEFTTSDLGVASFLLTRRHPVRHVSGVPGRRVFHFPKVAEVDARAYYEGATVEARALVHALSDAKTLLHERGR